MRGRVLPSRERGYERAGSPLKGEGMLSETLGSLVPLISLLSLIDFGVITISCSCLIYQAVGLLGTLITAVSFPC